MYLLLIWFLPAIRFSVVFKWFTYVDSVFDSIAMFVEVSYEVSAQFRFPLEFL